MENKERPAARENSIASNLEVALRMDEQICALCTEYGIKCIQIIDTHFGLSVRLLGHGKNKLSTLQIPLTIDDPKDSIDEMLFGVKNTVLRCLKQPINVATYNESAMDLSDMNSATDPELMLHAVQKYGGESTLAYALFDTSHPDMWLTESELQKGRKRERLPLFSRWLKKSIANTHAKLAELSIVAFWWRDDELTVIAEKSDRITYCGKSLQHSVVEEGMKKTLNELDIGDRVVIVDDEDEMLQGCTDLTRDASDDDEWDSPLRGIELEIVTDRNGLMQDEGNTSILLDRLSDLARSMPLALVIQPSTVDDDDDEEDLEGIGRMVWSVSIYRRPYDDSELGVDGEP